MSRPSSPRPPSGAEVASDFRDHLIIDRYDPVFAGMGASRRMHLQGISDEDAVAWNVFRSLRQIGSSIWLPDLFLAAFPHLDPPPSSHAVVHLWRTVAPPPSLLVEVDEGEAEIDVVVEAPDWVWFIEGRAGDDAAAGTASRRGRDRVLHSIDVGSYYAGVRDFYFSLLVADTRRSKTGVELVEEYRDLDRPRKRLEGHRADGLRNLRGISLLRWRDLADVLSDAASATAIRDDERPYAERALKWMTGRVEGEG